MQQLRLSGDMQYILVAIVLLASVLYAAWRFARWVRKPPECRIVCEDCALRDACHSRHSQSLVSRHD